MLSNIKEFLLLYVEVRICDTLKQKEKSIIQKVIDTGGDSKYNKVTSK